MSEFREVLNPADPFWEACARHTARQSTRVINHIYLCDRCASRLTRESFNQRPPIYHGETVEGYCGLCNTLQGVTLRLWFACPICWNVVVAYQKGFAASEAVHSHWRNMIAPSFPDLRLVEQDEIRLLPYARAPQTKKTAAALLTALDFVVIDNNQEPLFHIELKTGPGGLSEMREFQLDVNDSNDIMGAVNNTQLPAYIFHVKVKYEYLPPTRRAAAGGLWYTDIFTLIEHRRSVKQRRGEDKLAGYYSPAAFRPIDQFPSELGARSYEELRRRVLSQPFTLL